MNILHFLVGLAIFGHFRCKAQDVRVELDGLGAIVGQRERFLYEDEPSVDRNIDVFRGIPYAEAPIGSLRLAKTKAKEPWEGDYEARDFQPRCWAWRERPFLEPLKVPQAENCLYLNIWTPEAMEVGHM